jgi:rhamnosyltransferase
MPPHDQKKHTLLVVWYKPDEDTIEFWRKLSLLHQVIVMDNSPSVYDDQNGLDNIAHYVHNNNQGGIAGALNQGLHWAQSQGLMWCYLFDQDSRPGPHFFTHMMSKQEQHFSENLAVCSPLYFEQQRKYVADVINIEQNRLVRHHYDSIRDKTVVDAAYTITSGSLINIKSWQTIGQYDESLFLDFVDIEWGLRATQSGYKIIVFPDIMMKHTLGDQPIKFGKWKFVCHSPFRHYLYFRNLCFLLKKTHIPWVWKRVELMKLIPRFLVYSLFTNKKSEHCKAMLRGLWHGCLHSKIPRF